MDETDNEEDNEKDNELSSMQMALVDFDDLVDFVEALLPFPYAPLMVTRLMTAVVSFIFFLFDYFMSGCPEIAVAVNNGMSCMLLLRRGSGCHVCMYLVSQER